MYCSICLFSLWLLRYKFILMSTMLFEFLIIIPFVRRTSTNMAKTNCIFKQLRKTFDKAIQYFTNSNRIYYLKLNVFVIIMMDTLLTLISRGLDSISQTTRIWKRRRFISIFSKLSFYMSCGWCLSRHHDVQPNLPECPCLYFPLRRLHHASDFLRKEVGCHWHQ